MRSKILSFLILSFIFQIKVYGQAKHGSKGEEGMPPNGYEKMSINGIKINKNTLERLQFKTKRNAEPLKFYQWKDSIIDTTNYGYWDTISYGIVFKNIEGIWARGIQDQYASGIDGDSLYIYLTNLRVDTLKNSLYDIAISKAVTQFDVLKKVGTNSKNQDISNEQILKNLKLWNEENHFEIIAIDKNRIEVSLHKPYWQKQWDVEKFVNQLYELWPEVVDSSYGSKQKMVDYLISHKNFVLKFD